MSYGYSARLIEINKRADDNRLGVTLGRVCIALDIPVSVIAQDAGVSRQTVYNWFMGLYDPRPNYKASIVELISKLNERK
jgi:hypothetical protein